MKIIASTLGIIFGGGILAPVLISATSNSENKLAPSWKRSVSSGPVMVCETLDNRKDKYQVNLVFEQDWSSDKGDFNQEDLLKDLAFEFVEIKTGRVVERLSSKSSKGEKFQLTLAGVSDRDTWGITLQGKFGQNVPQKDDWTAFTCSTNNLVVVNEKCTHISTMCSQIKDFKDITFAYEGENKKTSQGEIRRGIVFSAESKLAWQKDFKPEVVFAFR